MFSAKEIVNQNVTTIDANESFSKALTLFKTTDAIVSMDGEAYQGMLVKRCVMRPKISLETKIHTLSTHAPKLAPDVPLDEIARLMNESGIFHLPVIDQDKLIGIVTADDVISKLTTYELGKQPVKTIMCTQPLSISPDETVGEVMDMFRRHDTPYLAVVDHSTVVGVITMDEILDKIMHPDTRMEGWAEYGDHASKKTKKMDLRVNGIMQDDPLMMPPESLVRDVINSMNTSDLPGVLIGKDHHLQGIVTHRELLAPFAVSIKKEAIEIQIDRKALTIEGFDKEQAIHFLRTEFLPHYEKFLGTGLLHVLLEPHKDFRHGIPRVSCRMRFSTPRGMFFAEHEGSGALLALKNTAQALDHQLRKAKGA